jgi:light-harvesting protein B-800-850 beta chain
VPGVPKPRLDQASDEHEERNKMANDIDDPDRVWPTGLTIKESEEIHKHVIDGARVFFVISVFAHILAYAFTPWGG